MFSEKFFVKKVSILVRSILIGLTEFYSQKEMSNITGIPSPWLSMYLSGNRFLTVDTFEKILKSGLIKPQTISTLIPLNDYEWEYLNVYKTN